MTLDFSTFEPETYIHIASLAVYVAALVWSVLAFIDIRQSSYPRAVKYVASGLVMLSVMTAVMFIASQIPWILDKQWKTISLYEALSWLLYDWLNGLSHLALVLAVRAFMRWTPPTPCQSHGTCPSSALARREREQDRELSGLSRDIQQLQQRIEHITDEGRARG